MGVQLIFVVETNKKCKSDWIYVKNTIDRFYTFNQSHVKLSPVYMDGKTKYKDKEKEVITLISKYKKMASKNESSVIYCFDCDEYDNKPEDAKFLNEVKSFCKKKNYNFVWFCKDIERVYLGRKVPDDDKKNEASKFMAKKLIYKVKEDILSVNEYRKNTSNILEILDKFITVLNRKIM